MRRWTLALFPAIALLPGLAYAAPPEEQPGELASCLLCHDVSPERVSTVGPPLWGIKGRKAGSVPGFAYSSVMIKYAIAWDRESLIAFLASPQKVLPGTKMAYAGEKDPAAAAQIADYLLSLE